MKLSLARSKRKNVSFPKYMMVVVVMMMAGTGAQIGGGGGKGGRRVLPKSRSFAEFNDI